MTFLAGLITGAVQSPEGSRYCQVSAFAYALQRAIPSARGRVTPRSSHPLYRGYRNLNRFAITSPLRVPLSPRLTLSRLTSLRKPWVFGVHVSTCIVVTYAYIFFSGRSSRTHVPPSAPSAMLPYRSTIVDPIASAAVLMPAHHPRVVARLVSCYALFE